MKIYSVNGTKVLILNEKGEKQEEKSLNDPGKLTREDKFGICCAMIAKGRPLSKDATGEDFRLSAEEFTAMASSDEKLGLMYKNAKIRRTHALIEQMVELKNDPDNEKKIKCLQSVLKACKEDLREIDQNEDRRITFRTFVSRDKKPELTEKFDPRNRRRRAEDSSEADWGEPNKKHLFPDASPRW